MNIEQQVTDAVEEIAEQNVEMAARVVRSFELWLHAREYKKKESKRLNDQLAGRIAQFSEAMHVGHSSTSDQVLKLSVVEQRWQELEDAREERKQVGSACRNAIKATEQKITDLLAEAKAAGQLNLFQPAAEAAAGDGEVDPESDAA